MLLVLSLAGGIQAHGQASATANRAADLVAYGGFSYVQPDWGPDGVNNKGFTFGGTYTRYFHLVNRTWGAGLDVRYNHDTGKTVNESGYTGNLQFQTQVVHRVHLYGTVGYGFGNIHFNYVPDQNDPSYRGDDGPILAGGGGVTYEVRNNIFIKGDYQFQNWTLGKNDTIDPSVFTFGVQYRLPFGNWTSHGYERN